MPAHAPSGEPFIGYRVTLAPDICPSLLHTLCAARTPCVRLVASSRRPVIVPAGQAPGLYETVQSLAREQAAPLPLQFTPVRRVFGRAPHLDGQPFAPLDLLHLVHEGFFGSARCREAAIAAVEACGALCVPALALAAVQRRSPRLRCERHVDTLIERETELRLAAEGRPGGARA